MNRPTESRTTARRWASRFGLAACLLPGCMLASGGCRVAKGTATLPVQVVTAVVPGAKSTQADPTALQVALQRYADDFASRTAAALEAYVRRAQTPAARSQALGWKLSLDSSVLGIATGPDPVANLFDFLALATLTRAFLEDRVRDAAPRGSLDPWLATSRTLETNAWKLAEGVLTTAQQAELRDAIERWRAENSSASATFFERPQEFASVIRQTGEKRAKPESVFNLVGLDPMAGLDPAVREMARTRLFAERALFAVQRLPILVRWHTELLADQLLRQEQVTAALQSAGRLSQAVESVSQTAALLPDRVTAERKAILEALEAQEGRLRELSAEVGRTLATGEKMSTSLTTTISAFDALMRRFGVGEPDSAPPDTNAPPFNILDYARTAEQIAAMAQQLDALIKDTGSTLDSPALDKRIADLNALSEQARADAKSVLNHAFLLAAGLILLALAAGLVYRRRGRALP